MAAPKAKPKNVKKAKSTRGRKPVDDATLAARGSRHVDRRRKEAKKRAIAVAERKPLRAMPLKRNPREIEEICRTHIPNYDPWADCEGFRFDAELACERIEFIENQLSHVRGQFAGEAVTLEPWELAIFGNIFGWVDSEGNRRYRTLLLYVPRGNGKTPMAAWLIDAILFDDYEPGAEIYGCAFEVKQAALLFAHAAGAVDNNLALKDRCQIFRGQQKAIQLNDHELNVDRLSAYQVITKNSGSVHGQQPHLFVLDEVHQQLKRDLVDTNETAMAKRGRRQPLSAYLTTADYERQDSICNELHDRAKRICAGIESAPRFLPVVYEASKDDDWTDPAIWEAANPNWNVTVDPASIAAMCEEAKLTPTKQNAFKRFHLNIRTDQEEVWITPEQWDSLKAEPVALEDLAGRHCFAGFDIGSTADMTAFVMAFPEDDGFFRLVPILWIPEARAEIRAKRDRIDYPLWIRQGFMRKTPGSATDYATVRRDINELAAEYKINIREVAADRLFQGEQICQELRELDGFNVIAHGQGFLSMAGPTKRFQELVELGKIRHDGHPVLRMHVLNVVVELDAAGNMKPNRSNKRQKIDAAVGAIMGLGRATADVMPRGSVYDERDVIELAV